MQLTTPTASAQPERPGKSLMAGWRGLGRRLQACALGLLAGLACQGAAAAGDWLSEQERAWLAAHPVVRVGADPDFAPYTFVDAQGRATGVAADYLAHLGPMLGVRFEAHNLPNWASVVQASRDKRIDMIAALARNTEREAWLSFTGIVIPTPLVVITRNDTRRLAGVDDLLGQRVALVRGYAASQRVVERLPGLQVSWRDSALGALAAVAAGEADAYVGVFGTSLYLIHLHSLANLKPNIGFDLLSHGQRFGVRKDWAILATILDKALARLPEADRLAIQARWMPAAGPREDAAARPLWTPAQQDWLTRAPVIRVALPRAMAPFAQAGAGGTSTGLAADLLTALGAPTGLRFEPVPVDGSDEALARLRRREVDMALGVDQASPATAAALASQVFYDSSYLVVCRRGQDCLTPLDAGAAMRVAVLAGSAGADHARRRLTLQLLELPTHAQALQALADDRVDAVLGESRRLLRALDANDSLAGSLQVGGVPEAADMDLRLLARDDWPMLVQVVDRGLHRLGDRGLSELRARWVGVADAKSDAALRARLRRVMTVVGIASVLVLLGVAWLWRHNMRLRAEVRRRQAAERQAADARRQAEAASLHKSEFVANTSHELRTPLNAILGTQHMLEGSPLDPRQRELLDIQRKAATSLLDLVDDLLDLARMETGAVRLRSAPFGLRGLLDDSLAIVREAARRKQLVLELDAGWDLPERVLGDGQRLQQVLVNLMGNAVKYTPKGKVTLRVRARRPGAAPAGAAAAGTQPAAAGHEPAVTGVASGQTPPATPNAAPAAPAVAPAASCHLRFEVEDTGPGIAADQRALVFEPFRRGAAAAGTEGTGLGLAIARHLVATMGGMLELDSPPGQGCCFHFGLSLALAPAEAPGAGGGTAAAASVPPDPGPGLRVLLVEDNEVNRLIATEVLRQRGCEVRVASDGRAALEALSGPELPQIVLLDVGLPEIDGLQVVRHLRAMEPPRSTIPVLGLTARALLHEREQCLAAGMDDVVHKPFLPDELWRHLCELVAAAGRDRADRPR